MRMNQFAALSLIWISSQTYAAVISTSSPYATQAAQEVLKKGGNAVDAACAALFALNVSQPYFAGIGGGAFILVDHGGSRTFINARETAPASTTEHLFFEAGQPIASWAARNTGGKSVGVPGAVAGCGQAIQSWGSLPWSQALRPALNLSSSGTVVTQLYGEELQEQWSRIKGFSQTRQLFGGSKRSGVKKGDLLKQPQLAATLRRLSTEGWSSFYRGRLARDWMQQARRLGVSMTATDLSTYVPVTATPSIFNWGTRRIETAPLPSVSGLMVGAALRYLDRYRQAHTSLQADSTERYISEVEVISYLSEIKNRTIADPARSQLNPMNWVGSREEQQAWEELDRRIAARLSRLSSSAKLNGATPSGNATTFHNLSASSKRTPANMKSRWFEQSHTAHISVVDNAGNAVAMTASLGNIFGSGLVVPGFGFVLNSQLGDFDENPGLPNSPRAGMRPRSNQSPTFVYDVDGAQTHLVAAIGAAGGPLIPSAIVQVLQNYFVFRLPLEEAVGFPRVHISGGKVSLERSAPSAVADGLRRAGYEVSLEDTIWSVLQVTARRSSSAPWEARHDPRYDGAEAVNL